MSSCLKRLTGLKRQFWHSTVIFISTAVITSFFHLNLVQAQSFSGESFPKEFKYQNRPIDPLCIEKITMDTMARASSVNIDDCSKHPDYQVTKVNDDLIRKGYIGYDYSYRLPNAVTMQGTSYYRYLGKINDLHLIYSMQNNGGSGFLTSIMLIERIGNKLRLVKELAGGDRCNGGIDPNIQIKGKIVSYKASVTPYDIIAFSGAMEKNVQPYDDLADCAACCLGDAMFEYDLSSDAATPKLISLTLGQDAGRDEVYNQGKLQSCFNKVLRDYSSKNKNMKFSSDQLKEFAQQFNAACIK